MSDKPEQPVEKPATQQTPTPPAETQPPSAESTPQPPPKGKVHVIGPGEITITGAGKAG